MAGTEVTVLTRENLTSVKNLFVLNPANISYLQGTSARPFGAPTMTGSLVFLLLAAILGGCPLAGAASTPDSGSLMGLALILGVPCLLGTAWAYRRYRHAVRLEKGVLLQATITGVSTSESVRAANFWATVRAALIGMSDNSYYELALQFTATTPNGTQVSGTAIQNRPDLRGSLPPQVGDPLVILYVDDTQYKVL